MVLRLTHIYLTQKLFVSLSFLMLLSFFLPLPVWASDNTAGPSEPAVVAEGGNGFRVTEKDVQELIEFFTTHTMFQTTEKEYRRYTVQTFLFATEAERLGLVSKEYTLPENPVQKRLVLANIYLDHRLQSLRLEPEAVESYYRALPERFLRDPESDKWRSEPKPFIDESDLLAFEEVASQIEAFLKGQLRKTMEAAAFQELMAAYHVAWL